MDKLSAVNRVLMAVGVRPVAALDTGGYSEAGLAERMVDESDQDIQGWGWHWNIEYEVEIAPDGSNNIVVPAGAIRIDSDGCHKRRNVVNQGGTLYDLDEQTDQFDETLTFTIVYRRDWDIIPQPFQEWIAEEAAVRFNERFKGNGNAHPGIIDRRDKAKVRARHHSLDTRDTNYLKTDEMTRLKGHRRRYPSGY
jgi:hypothetical protein